MSVRTRHRWRSCGAAVRACNVAWLIGGRNPDQLERLAADAGLPAGVQRIVADSGNPPCLREAFGRARVVLATVGPYARYGSDVVATCAEPGVHYCDLPGEVYWMRRMIDAHEESARASGACIVHTCGFDSMPSGVGSWLLQREMLRCRSDGGRDRRRSVRAEPARRPAWTGWPDDSLLPPAAALGEVLLERLPANAGLTFELTG